MIPTTTYGPLAQYESVEVGTFAPINPICSQFTMGRGDGGCCACERKR